MTGSEMTMAPFIVMIAGALLVFLIPRRAGSAITLVIPLLALCLVWLAPDGINLSLKFMDYRLVLFKVDRLSRVFGTIFTLITFIGSLFAFHVRERGQQTAAMLYAAGAVGVTFAGDFFTLFLFWELMSLPSAWLVWAARTDESGRAGMRYLIFHLFGGSLLLAGILMHLFETGSLEIGRIAGTSVLSAWFILAGIAINAAVVPLHVWLPDAYPKATVTGAVFMSALTTKTAVYVLLRVFSGWEILLYLGVLMTLYGVIYAILSNDIRGILSYHIISQVGYMVAGAGIGTELAINGAAAHAFSHILYKALLFMGAGSVLYATGKSKMTELGGLAARQRYVLLLYMVGAFSISGFPLFNGFISKSMVIASAAESHYTIAMFLMTLASVGTFLSVGLKLPWFTWFGEKQDIPLKPVKPNMYLGMAAAASLCLLYGLMPRLLYDILPYPVSFVPYTVSHLVETSQILLFTFAGFWLYQKKLSGHEAVILDTDWFYRRPSGWLQDVFTVKVETFFDVVQDTADGIVQRLAAWSRNPAEFFRGGKDGVSYSPDFYRPTVGSLIAGALLVFVILAGWSVLN